MTAEEPMICLFQAAGLAALHGFIDRDTLFAFDLDGTLAPITTDPEAIQVPRDIREDLLRLMELAPVAVITGRSRSDALVHLGFTPHYLIGNHGAEGLPGMERREAEFRRVAGNWERQLTGMLPPFDQSGLLLENKGATLAVHYRRADDREAAVSLIRQCFAKLEPRPRRVSGKCVENLVPDDAPDKGYAFLQLLNHAGTAKGLFVGDDVTDEDVFRLDAATIFTICVGTERASHARYSLRDQQETGRLLREIIETLRPISCRKPPAPLP